MFSVESSRVAVIYVRVRVSERELGMCLFKPEYYLRGERLKARKIPAIGFIVIQKKCSHARKYFLTTLHFSEFSSPLAVYIYI